MGAALYYYYKPAPSCKDGAKNQDELGIDCGGSCPQVCPVEIQDPRVLWSRVLEVGEGKYDSAVFIENPNPRHGIKQLDYTLRIVDKDNILIGDVAGQTFLNPKEQLVIFTSRLNVGLRVPARVIFEIANPPIWQKIEKPMPKLTVVKKGFTNAPRSSQFIASITNDSLESLKNVEVVVVLSDIDGNAMAISSTFMETLDPGETKELSFTWPESLAQEPTTIDLYPHFNLSGSAI
jgi:hypothetical protein